MIEAGIRKKVKEILVKDGWAVWTPAKVRFHETDIMGVFDLLAWRQGCKRWIQYTSLSNVAARKKKVIDFLNKVKAPFAYSYYSNSIDHYEVWGYDDKKKIFKVGIL